MMACEKNLSHGVGDSSFENIRKTTHFAISAHQDDIEIMAFHGILACYQQEHCRFGACVVTDGRGTPRAGEFADVSDDEMVEIRAAEQAKAAEIGDYANCVLLGHRSSGVRQLDFEPLTSELVRLLSLAQPKIIYTHNLADKHKTHLAVGLHVIKAIRRLPRELRPEKLYGCEVWRSLDFLPDTHKVLLDVSARPELQSALINAFRSQIAGGKNYEQAVIGRRLANATFQDPYAPDAHSRLSIAMDMTPLILDDQLCPRAFMREILRATRDEIDGNLASFLGDLTV